MSDGELLVIGHRNPDTDAICSAIGYAEFKRRTGWPSAEAARCGDTIARSVGRVGSIWMLASRRLSGRQKRARALKPFPEERDKCRTTPSRRLRAILGVKIIGDGV